MFYGRLLDKNTHRCEPLADLSYPVVLSVGLDAAHSAIIVLRFVLRFLTSTVSI